MIDKIVQKAKWVVWTQINRGYFSIKGVKYGKNFRSNGRIYIKRVGGTIEIGDNVRINSGLTYNPIGGGCRASFQVLGGRLIIGNNVGMSNPSLTCAKEITIGTGTDLGDGVKIFDTDFHCINPDIRHSNEDFKFAKKKKVLIEENVFVGTQVCIMKGVHIGRKACVGACSVVTKEVPAGEIWAGNPAKYVKLLQSTHLGGD